MKILKTFNGNDVEVDDEDFPVLNRFSWHFIRDTFPYTAHKPHQDNGKKTTHNLPITIFLTINRFGKKVIPIDGNYLNCKKENLKLVFITVKKQNARKVKLFRGKLPTSKYKGVSYNKKNGNWRAYINPRIRDGLNVGRGHQISLGSYKTENEAALAYNKKAFELYGEMAYQNKIST